MSTLDELMKIHPPGTKFTNATWISKTPWACWFKGRDNWYGTELIDSETIATTHPGHISGWSLYQEPPRKVKKYLWARKWSNDFVLVCQTEQVSVNGGNGAYTQWIPQFMSEQDIPEGVNWTKVSIIDGHIGIEVEDTP